MRKIFDVNKTRRCTAYLNSIIILKYINHTNWAVTYTYVLLKLILYVFNWQFSYNPKLTYVVWVIINTIRFRLGQDLNDSECILGVIKMSVFIFLGLPKHILVPYKMFFYHLNSGNVKTVLRSSKVTILILSVFTGCCWVDAAVYIRAPSCY